MRKAKKESEKAEHKDTTVSVPFRFDDAIRRALKVSPPDEGRNVDYVEANDERTKPSKKGAH